LDVQTLPTCCELYVTHTPLAILSRGGARCWLSSRMYEDGIEYALTASRHISFAEEPSNCGLNEGRSTIRVPFPSKHFLRVTSSRLKQVFHAARAASS